MKSLIVMAAMTAAALAVQPVAAQAAAAPAAAGPAAAAPSKAAASPANSKAPIDITSDQEVSHNADCTATWTGSAEALQNNAGPTGLSRLRADTMIAHMEIKKGKPSTKANAAPDSSGGSDCGDMVSLEAKGNVYYASSDGRRVHGDNAFYDAASTTITITGDVTAVENENVMRGTKMVYNTQTGESHVEGGGKGPGAKNRPRGVFYPKDANSDAQGDASSQADNGAKPKKKAAK